MNNATNYSNMSPLRLIAANVLADGQSAHAGTSKHLNRSIKLLLAEDSNDDARLVLRTLKRGGFELQYSQVQSAEDFEAALKRESWDAVISDYNMPNFSGLGALKIIHATGLDIPFILVSGTVGEEIAVEALRAGAHDYILKANIRRLPSVLERELNEAAIRADHRRARDKILKSEAGLHRAQSMAKLAHIITAPDGSFEEWSDNLPQLIGLEPERMPCSTREWMGLVHPEDLSLFRSTAVDAGTEGKTGEVEYRLQRPGGECVYLRQTMEPLDGESEPSGKARWFNTLQDITAQKHAIEELRQSESRFRSLPTLFTDWYWEQDQEFRFTRLEGRGTDMSGYDSTRALGKKRWELNYVGMTDELWHAHRADLEAHRTFHELELNTLNEEGENLWVSISGHPILDVNGRFLGYRGIGKDTTQRKSAEERIKRLTRVYAVLSGINALIVRSTSKEELFKEACRIAVEEGKFPLAWIGRVDRASQEIVLAARAGDGAGYTERMPLALDGPSHAQGMLAAAVREQKAMVANDIASDPRMVIGKEAVERGFRSLVVLPLTLAGEVVGLLALYAEQVGFFDEEEMKLLRELAGDISFALDHIVKAEKLDYLAFHDSLTGLANRALFHERLEQHISTARRASSQLAVVMYDIERFKTINDTLGRQAGDELLKQIAERIRLHGNPDRQARIGADHFAVVVPDMQTAEALARRIETRMNEFYGTPFRIADTELRIAAKVGVAVFPDNGNDADTLLRNAEAALKKSKAKGERYVFYTHEMTERVADRLSLENKLRQAVEKEEFVLYYQPKVDLESRKIVGVEALIRWQSPDRGLVPPLHFIPLLEETGLILQVGAWALGRAARDHRGWVEQKLKAPRVAVNVSPIQLRQRHFVGVVEQAIIDGVAPTGIDLEITESLIMEDVQGTIEKLNTIRGLGVNTAIDDFGTGYSSLAYLAKLPVETLKIDRAFIIKMTEEANATSLVQTMISLAHSLNLKVVAEGVETEEQAKMLRLMRCDQMQGYLFSKPLPFEEMTALLKKHVH